MDPLSMLLVITLMVYGAKTAIQQGLDAADKALSGFYHSAKAKPYAKRAGTRGAKVAAGTATVVYGAVPATKAFFGDWRKNWTAGKERALVRWGVKIPPPGSENENAKPADGFEKALDTFASNINSAIEKFRGETPASPAKPVAKPTAKPAAKSPANAGEKPAASSEKPAGLSATPTANSTPRPPRAAPREKTPWEIREDQEEEALGLFLQDPTLTDEQRRGMLGDWNSHDPLKRADTRDLLVSMLKSGQLAKIVDRSKKAHDMQKQAVGQGKAHTYVIKDQAGTTPQEGHQKMSGEVLTLEALKSMVNDLNKHVATEADAAGAQSRTHAALLKQLESAANALTKVSAPQIAKAVQETREKLTAAQSAHEQVKAAMDAAKAGVSQLQSHVQAQTAVRDAHQAAPDKNVSTQFLNGTPTTTK